MHMFKYITCIIIALCVITGSVSCTGGKDTDPVERVAAMLRNGNAEDAQRDCDRLLADTTAFNALSAGQLCRLALVFVSFTGDQESNDGAAVRCLNRARSLNNDSVESFLLELNDVYGGHLVTLDRVGTYLEIPREELVSAEDVQPDSLN